MRRRELRPAVWHLELDEGEGVALQSAQLISLLGRYERHPPPLPFWNPARLHAQTRRLQTLRALSPLQIWLAPAWPSAAFLQAPLCLRRELCFLRPLSHDFTESAHPGFVAWTSPEPLGLALPGGIVERQVVGRLDVAAEALVAFENTLGVQASGGALNMLTVSGVGHVWLAARPPADLAATRYLLRS